MTVINNVHESFGQSLLLHCATSATGIAQPRLPGLGNTAADIGQHRRRPCPTGEPKSPCTPSRYWAIGIVEVGRVDKQKVLLTNDSKELFDFLGF
ncbi:MAG: hypothetical protein RIF36_18130 [Imperialibacter sp.]|uniref:hypothetical protein n=1 Tax=Imperialibacter sp. TaxID=2038411 RepID=UPI0032EACF29